MIINSVGTTRLLPPLPVEDIVEEKVEDQKEEGLKKVEKARRAVEAERLEIMDRHHETVKKSAETYDKIVKKRLMEKEIEERRLQQKEFLAERNEEAERRRDEMRKAAEKD